MRMLLTPGSHVERYVVEELVGRGATSEVYRVRHTTLGVTRALKVLTDDTPVSRFRFDREIRVLARLKHPNVIRVYDVLAVDDHPALLMEYGAGGSLRRRLERGPIPVEDALVLFRGIVAGVAAAHEIGVLHRDLKPENILIEEVDGVLVPRVADFGIARAPTGGDAAGLTTTGNVVGTPGFLAPEVLAGTGSQDERVDVFSLGCILYELVCGVPPFRRATAFQTQLANFHVEYTPPERLQPALPPAARDTLMGCLVADPERRLRSCAAVLECLDGRRAPVAPDFWAAPVSAIRVPRDAPEGASARPGPRRETTRWRAGPTLVGVGAGLLALAGVGAGLFWMVGGSGADEASARVEDPPDEPGVVSLVAPMADVVEPPLPALPYVAPGPDPSAHVVVPGAAGEVEPPVSVQVPRSAVEDHGGGERRVGVAPIGAGPLAVAPTPGPLAEPVATVTWDGASALWLRAGSGQESPGRLVPGSRQVVPGSYRVLASFDGGAPVDAGTVRLAAGDIVHIHCEQDFFQCRP